MVGITSNSTPNAVIDQMLRITILQLRSNAAFISCSVYCKVLLMGKTRLAASGNYKKDIWEFPIRINENRK